MSKQRAHDSSTLLCHATNHSTSSDPEQQVHADARITTLADPANGLDTQVVVTVTISQSLGHVSAVYSEHVEDIGTAKALANQFLRFFNIPRIREENWCACRNRTCVENKGT